MQWSQYNFLFKSEQFGFFLYNALSNVFVELKKEYYDFLIKLKEDIHYTEKCDDARFKDFLFENKIVVGEDEEEKTLLLRQYRREAQCFNNADLGLTICPTTACNFRCPYCFEKDGQVRPVTMSRETMDQVAAFAGRFSQAKNLTVTWFGGEPTLAFDRIEELTAGLRSLDITFTRAGMITNGYLLDREKIDKLNDLAIRFVQITLDGPREIHDARRVRVDGGPTFQTIIGNIETLAASDFKGRCSVRVNVDKTNCHTYPAFRAWFKEKFPQKNIEIYSHYVFNSPESSFDHGCELNMAEWSEYTLSMYRDHKIPPRYGLHPTGGNYGTCVATNRNGFVVGPEGEIYKCWNDVGYEDKIVGSIYREDTISNPELVAMYSTGIDPHLDPTCRDCLYLPICSGGCAGRRLSKKYFHQGDYDCSRYKTHLIPFLEAYYDLFMTREICKFYLNHEGDISCKNGFRLVRIETKTSNAKAQE